MRVSWIVGADLIGKRTVDFVIGERIVVVKFVSTNEYRKWISDYIKKPEHRDLVTHALDAFDQAKAAPMATIEEISPVVDAARCSSIRIWEIGVDLLAQLTTRHVAAQDAIREMLAARSAQIRFQAMVAFRMARLLHPLAVELLGLALRDRSSRVRGMAGEQIGRLRLTELAPALRDAAESEKAAQAKEGLTFDLVMLTDGYFVSKMDKVVFVHLHQKRSYWVCVPFDYAEDDTIEVEKVIAQVRRTHND